MVCSTRPVRVSTTLTVPSKRLETHSCRPSGETWSMSGFPPTGQVAMTRRVLKLMTEMVPAPRVRVPEVQPVEALHRHDGLAPIRREVQVIGERHPNGPDRAALARVDDRQRAGSLVLDVEPP